MPIAVLQDEDRQPSSSARRIHAALPEGHELPTQPAAEAESGQRGGLGDWLWHSSQRYPVIVEVSGVWNKSGNSEIEARTLVLYGGPSQSGQHRSCPRYRRLCCTSGWFSPYGGKPSPYNTELSPVQGALFGASDNTYNTDKTHVKRMVPRGSLQHQGFTALIRNGFVTKGVRP